MADAELAGPAFLLAPQDSEAWARSQALLEASLARGECTAWSLAVRRHHRPLGSLQLGSARAFTPAGALPGPLVPVPTPEPLTAEHTFDWASLTKVLSGQLLCMQLVGGGQLAIDEALSGQLPPLRRGGHARITVDQALRYTTGLPAWRPMYVLARERVQFLDALAGVPMHSAPGHRRLYSDLGHLALTFFLESRLGMRLDVAFATRVAQRLPLRRTGYCPQQSNLLPSVATSHGNVFERRLLGEPGFGLRAQDPALEAASYSFANFRDAAIVGEVDDGNAHYLLQGVSAHAGLFGPADDLAHLAEAIVLAGPGAAALELTPSVQAAFLRVDERGHLPTWWHGHELGLRGLPPPCAGQPAPAVMLRGFSGTMVYVEPSLGLTVALVSNREHVSGQGEYTNLRPVLHDVVELWRTL